MIRTVLDRQMQALSEQILSMWVLSDQAFEKGLEALKQLELHSRLLLRAMLTLHQLSGRESSSSIIVMSTCETN